MKYYSYEEFTKDTRSLIEQVKEYKPEVIVAIARGGLTLAHTISEGLDIRDVQTIRTELYDECEKRDSISIFGECNFKDKKRVLVLDDISDSGDTLSAVMSHFTAKYRDIEFKTATLFYSKDSKFKPDVWINESTQWIDFFWERDFK
jgi:xanthine phosphoribosyltransferase